MKVGRLVRRGGIALALAGGSAGVAGAQDHVANPHVSISLVPEFQGAVPGAVLAVAVRFQLEPGWHIYWENPGQAGIATSVRWSVSPGIGVGPVTWPVPALLLVSGIVTHVHYGDVALATRLMLPPKPQLSPVRIAAELRYGVCRDLCLPGSARLSLELPWVSGPPRPEPGWGEMARRIAGREPAPQGGPSVTATLQDSVVVLEVRSPTALAGQVTFFPADQGIASAAVTATVSPTARTATLRLPLVGSPAGPLRGVLVLGDPSVPSPTGFAVSVRLRR
jgi:DsbC/DsbD-like thiol-disulfide interchange protein